MDFTGKQLYVLQIEPKHKILFDAILGTADIYKARTFVSELIEGCLNHLHNEDYNSGILLTNLVDDALELTGFDFIHNSIEYKLGAAKTMEHILSDIINTWALHLLVWNVPLGVIDIVNLTNVDVSFVITEDD